MDDEVASTVDAREGGRELATPGDATQTAAQPLRDETPPGLPEERLAAPLQTRDPDRYEILGEHGRGGLGRVFRAHDKELGRDIAVKELLERGNTSEVRFLREALITARLEHPGIVPVHEAGRWPDGTPFYAMKLVSGSPLKTLIERCETMEQRLALIPNVIAVADAIAYAHDRKIIHRDLKPSNVIVGEFGETVVIDWGLAKALDEVTTTIDSPYRGSQGHELTASGSVLGTPAYMAPEQHKGLADERTDIYAIGGVLFHVLAGRPPHRDDRPPDHQIGVNAFPRETPRDLVAIVGRSMAEQPSQRYPSAHAFADDLRRYLQNLPVRARHYSALARLGRVVARYRSAALGSVAALVVIVATLVVSVLRIDGERADAVEARTDAEAARNRAEAANGDLILQHAELQLHVDPTAALSTVGAYRGPDTTRRHLIEAEAKGRGVADVLQPGHADVIRLVAGNADGSIVSIGDDRRVRLTRDGRTSTLVDDLSLPIVATYGEKRQRVAYASASSTIVFDIETGARTVFPWTSSSLALSPDEQSVATLDRAGNLLVSTISTPSTTILSRDVHGAFAVIFADPEHLVTYARDGFRSISLSGKPDASLAARGDVFDARQGYLALGEDDGTVGVFDLDRLRLVRSMSVCRGQIADVRLLPVRTELAYACDDGRVGVSSTTTDLARHDLFSVEGHPFAVASAFDDSSLVVRTDSDLVFTYDLERGVVRRYEGHARLTTVSPPTSVYPHLLTADFVGTVRRWSDPGRAARLLAKTGVETQHVYASMDSKWIASATGDGAVRVVSVSTGAVTKLAGHHGPIAFARFTSDGRFLISHGSDGTVHVWNADTFVTTRIFGEHHGSVDDIDIIDNGRLVVSVGDDGRLLQWSPAGTDSEVLFATSRPLVALASSRRDGSVVVNDNAGSIWHVRPGSATRQVRVGSSEVTKIRFSRDGRRFVVGTKAGEVLVYDASTDQPVLTAVLAGGIRTVDITPEGDRVVAVSEQRQVQLIDVVGPHDKRWTKLALDASDALLSGDGRVLSLVIPDGGVWIYSFDRDSWWYSKVRRDPVTLVGRFFADGSSFATTSVAGDIVVYSIPDILAEMAH